MKRTLLSGTFLLLAGAFTLLLLASIFYSCRSGGTPHRNRPSGSLHAPPAQETHRSIRVARAAERDSSFFSERRL